MEAVAPCQSSLGVAAPADSDHHLVFTFTQPILDFIGGDGSIHHLFGGVRVGNGGDFGSPNIGKVFPVHRISQSNSTGGIAPLHDVAISDSLFGVTQSSHPSIQIVHPIITDQCQIVVIIIIVNLIHNTVTSFVSQTAVFSDDSIHHGFNSSLAIKAVTPCESDFGIAPLHDKDGFVLTFANPVFDFVSGDGSVHHLVFRFSSGLNRSTPCDYAPVIRRFRTIKGANFSEVAIMDGLTRHAVLTHQSVDAVHRIVTRHSQIIFIILINNVRRGRAHNGQTVIIASDSGKSLEKSGIAIEAIAPSQSGFGLFTPSDGHHNFILAFTNPIFNFVGGNSSVL